MFRVGMRVVCVDAKPTLSRCHPLPLQEGAVYTVTWHGPGPAWGEPCVQLAEVGETDVLTGFFLARRFRPAVEKSTDISIFTAMLTPKKEHVNA